MLDSVQIMVKRLKKLVALYELLGLPTCDEPYSMPLKEVIMIAYNAAKGNEEKEKVSRMCEQTNYLFHYLKHTFNALPSAIKEKLDKIVRE